MLQLTSELQTRHAREHAVNKHLLENSVIPMIQSLSLCRLWQLAVRAWVGHWYRAASGKLIAARHRQRLMAAAMHAFDQHARQRKLKYSAWRAAAQHWRRSVFTAFRRSAVCTLLLSCRLHYPQSVPRYASWGQVRKLLFAIAPIMYKAKYGDMLVNLFLSRRRCFFSVTM